jgi:hypothetical protein
MLAHQSFGVGFAQDDMVISGWLLPHLAAHDAHCVELGDELIRCV